MRGLAGLRLLALLACAACDGSLPEADSDPSGEDEASDTLEQQIGPVARDAGASGGWTCQKGNVWKSNSRRIEVVSFGFWQGSTGYRADRAQLTSAQLRALDGLCARPTPTGPEVSDLVSYHVKITTADNSVVEYRAVPGNALDGDEASHDLPTLDYDSLSAFLGTFKCLRAAESRATRATSIDPNAPWSSAPLASSDPSCLHGVFAPYNCGEAWIKLQVRQALRQTISTERCVGTLQLKLFDASGKNELGATPASNAPRCPKLAYSFTPGTYLLQLKKTNGTQSCEVRGAAGDFLVRISPP
ncbi:MAG: hypothetical protein ABW252_17725 [Polyangiales bacterium]